MTRPGSVSSMAFPLVLDRTLVHQLVDLVVLPLAGSFSAGYGTGA